MSQYPTDDKDGMNFTDVTFPVYIRDIPKFERQNNMAINVFGLDKKKVIVYYLSKQKKGLPRINLLLLENKDGSHYTWIKDLNKLYNGSKDGSKRFFCDRCITSNYSTEEDLDKHKEVCEGVENAAVRVEMPKNGKNILKFKNMQNKMPVPFVIYADFECIDEKILHAKPSDTKSHTTNIQKHVACSYCYIVVRSDGNETSGKLSCLANNGERYVTFSIGGLQFVDSVQFLQTNLEKLTENTLKSEGLDGFPISKAMGDYGKRWVNWNDNFAFLTKKGVYPNDAMDSWESFERESLPTKEEFYNQLTREGISDDNYNHAKTVFSLFLCKNMGDYCDLYCRTDVLLLADIFEKYRKVTRKIYGLDPARYLTSPGLSWDALQGCK